MKKTEDKKKVCIYIRVSSEEQAKEGYSLNAQKNKLEEYAQFKDYWVYKIYTDAGVSGKSIKGRKAFQEMIEDAKQEKFSATLVYKFDRAWRNVRDAIVTLEDLSKIGVDFISITENIDTTTAMGKAVFGVISVFAQLERDLTGERLNLTLHDKFNSGINIGRCPTGYKWDKKKKIMIIDDKKAEMIRDIFKMASEKINYKEICEKYNLKPQSYYNIIRNKVYIGIISFEGVEKSGIHQPLISEELFLKVNS